jgi:Glycosyltransferases involved in cell wall biogenesis
MISVCIATYNGEKYVKEQIDSILPQLSEADEIIVSDDGSIDSTLQIVRNFADSRIKIVTNVLGKGVNHNFENALNNAQGDILFLADQDDIWLPNKVSVCIDDLNHCDLVVSNCIVIDGNDNVIYPSYFDIAKSGNGFFKNLYRSTYLGCCLAFKREALDKILPIPNSLLLFHDWWFGFMSEVYLKVSFNPTPCMYYRRHNETNSKTVSKSELSLYNKLRYRLQLLFLGFQRIIKIKLKL